MKKITLTLVAVLSAVILFAQTPQAFKYQAVVRDNLGDIIANQEVSFRISIHDGTPTGTIVYQEIHDVTTNEFGLVNLEIGNGDPPITGFIKDIDWGTNEKFMEVELDLEGGDVYISLGTTQLLAVPYALYSESTGDTTRWKKNEDDLYFENGNVGIGTDSPGSWAKLDIKGNLSVDGIAYINHIDATESILDFYNSISDWELVGASDANRFDIRKWGDVPALSIDENNFVGIGTTSPTYNLDIMSNSTAASRLRLSNLDYSKTLNFSSGSDLFDPSIYFQGGDALRFMYFDGGYSELMRIQSDGDVGIGIDTPDESALLEMSSDSKGFLPPRLSKIELLNIPTPAEGLVVYNTTSKTLNVFNGSEWVDMMGNEVLLEIGDYFQGGVIFYLDGSGGGLICAVSDQSSGAEWGCMVTEISGADGTAIGTGAQNTIDIEAGCATPGIAADICANLSLNGYDDWFLPSQDELNEMYQNKAAIDATATANGGAAFISAYYWSSSEDSDIYAWRQNFGYGGQSYGNKYYTFRVRAVRAF